MKTRSIAITLGLMALMSGNCFGDFRAEVTLGDGQKVLLNDAWLFANNGFGGNSISRDAFSGKDATGATKEVRVSVLLGAEITAGRGPRSVVVIYADNEREELHDVPLAFVNGRDKRGSRVEISLFDKTGVITVKFLPPSATPTTTPLPKS